MNSKGAGGGFTLLEVLLAMAILAAVASVVFAAFSTTGRSVQQADAVRDDVDLARTLMARMSNDIANAYIKGLGSRGIFFGKKESVEIDGQERRFDALSLTTLTNWRRPGTRESELWEVGYLFKERPEGTGRVLFRREKRELNNEVPVLEGGEEYEVTGRIGSLQLRYSADNRTWKDDWDSRKTPVLPRQAEITLMLDDGRVFVTRVDVRN